MVVRCCWSLTVALLAGHVLADDAASVSARDTGVSTHPAQWECTRGHTVENRTFTFETGAARYSFAYSGCVDPAHGEERPSSEGNFGMPSPTRCNFYAGGFIGLILNGKDAVRYRVADMQLLETGPRGAMQAVFAHPDATVGLRLAALPGSNHVLALVTWKPNPGATINSVQIKLTAYPSYFTTFNHRQGERHCRTPRADECEPNTLSIAPAEDRWLYLYDGIFDVARGEGEGPCAILVGPEGCTGGQVALGSYAVSTLLAYDPAAGSARLGFYDFAGQTNAKAEAYLRDHGAEDLAQLRTLDFRPTVVQHLDVATFQAETRKLLDEAADDGQAMRPRLEELLTKVVEQHAAAQAGDWSAEARLSALLRDSDELLWNLRVLALLNRE